MARSCRVANALLVAAVAVMAYLWLVEGRSRTSTDGRTAIVLTPPERDLVLGEMRGFLVAVQAIAQAVATTDMAAVAASARKAGLAAAGEVPAALRAKLPLEFKKRGAAAHAAFDDIAAEAQDMGDREVVLRKLGTLLLNCTTCHAGYRLATEATGDE
jgi:mono/diheme cytochrome c family protein